MCFRSTSHHFAMSIFSPSETNIRSVVGIAGIAGAFFLPWWVPLVCMIGLALRYPAWEVLVIGLVMDLLWLPGQGFEWPVFLITGIVLVWICAPLRNQFLRP